MTIRNIMLATVTHLALVGGLVACHANAQGIGAPLVAWGVSPGVSPAGSRVCTLSGDVGAGWSMGLIADAGRPGVFSLNLTGPQSARDSAVLNYGSAGSQWLSGAANGGTLTIILDPRTAPGFVHGLTAGSAMLITEPGSVPVAVNLAGTTAAAQAMFRCENAIGYNASATVAPSPTFDPANPGSALAMPVPETPPLSIVPPPAAAAQAGTVLTDPDPVPVAAPVAPELPDDIIASDGSVALPACDDPSQKDSIIQSINTVPSLIEAHITALAIDGVTSETTKSGRQLCHLQAMMSDTSTVSFIAEMNAHDGEGYVAVHSEY